jgi:membrane protease YdiL (CAAX protease family)
MRKWNVGSRWYLIVVGLPVPLAGVSLLAGVVTGGIDLASYESLLPASYFIPFFVYMLVFTGVYEEPGWRGFALPYLQRENTATRASWILGIVWAVWHFPIIIYYNLTVTEVAPPVLIPILAGLVMGTVGWTIVNTWIYNSTESVFLMILLHGWYNTVNAFAVLPFENMMVTTVNSVLPWAVAGLVSKRHGDENLAERPRPTLANPVSV